VAIHFIQFPADNKYLYILVNFLTDRMSQIDVKYFKAFLKKTVGSPVQILLYSPENKRLFLFVFLWIPFVCFLATWRKN